MKPTISRHESPIDYSEIYTLKIPKEYIVSEKFWKLKLTYWILRLIFTVK